MAAAGGFWAKGAFFGPAEVSLMSMAYFPGKGKLSSADEMKGLFADGSYTPEKMKDLIVGTLSAMHEKYNVGPYSHYGSKIKEYEGLVGAEKAQQMMADAYAKEKAAVVVNNQGIQFTHGDIEKLAKANGTSFDKMKAKLEGYKSVPTLKKWQAAANSETGEVPKAAPKVKQDVTLDNWQPGDPIPPPPLPPLSPSVSSVTPKDLSFYQASLPSEFQFKPYGFDTADMMEYSKWASGLPSAYKAAVKDYTGSGFAQLNAEMRKPSWNPDAYPNSALTKKAATLNAALDSAPPLAKNATFYRGLSNETVYNAVASGKLAVGSQIVDSAFMSTSTKSSMTSWGGGSYHVAYRILAPAGTKGGGYVDTISSHKGEQEFIWKAGTSMTVIGAKMGHINGYVTALVDLVPTEAVK